MTSQILPNRFLFVVILDLAFLLIVYPLVIINLNTCLIFVMYLYETCTYTTLIYLDQQFFGELFKF